jgi:transposase InsO family protein
VRPNTNLKEEQAVTFFTDIIHRFGVPNYIITDNGSQFIGRKFLEFCDKHHNRVDWAAVAHPQTNGQVERANGMILQAAGGGVEPHNHTEQGHEIHPVLPGLWCRGHPPHGPGIRVA